MKKVLIFLLSVVMTMSVFASVISRDSAEVLALRYFHSHGGSAKVAKLVNIADKSDLQNMYIFVPEDGSAGFVIFSASDQYTPVIGYSVENSVEMPLPNHVQSFLSKIDENIAYAESFRAKPVQGWQELASPSSSIKKKSKGISAVAPMIETHWDQGSGYNNHCPVIGGSHCSTGCVATSMAQVLRYWKYPRMGMPIKEYEYNNVTYSCGATVFDWDNMPVQLNGSSTQEEIDAVATLMYYCGVGVKMLYDNGGSSAFSEEEPLCLKNYLGYNDSVYIDYAVLHDSVDWIAKVMNEVLAHRPVIYGGYGNMGGHSFIVDGVNADSCFHINWGWSGYFDGYFAYGNFVPTYIGGVPLELNDEQEACLIIKPAESFLRVNPTTAEFNRYGDSTIINIISEHDVAWTIDTTDCNCSWLSFSHLTGAGKDSLHEVKVYATANEDGTFGDCRRAKFSVVQDGYVKTVGLYQYNSLISSPDTYGNSIDLADTLEQTFYGDSLGYGLVVRTEAFGNFDDGQMITSVSIGIDAVSTDSILCSVVVLDDATYPERFDVYDSILPNGYFDEKYWGHEVYSEDFVITPVVGKGKYTLELALPAALSKNKNTWVEVIFHNDANVLYKNNLVRDSIDLKDNTFYSYYKNRIFCKGVYEYICDFYYYLPNRVSINEERTMFNYYEREYDITFNVINSCNEVDDSLRLAVEGCDTYMLPDRMVDKSKKYASLVSNVADGCDSVFLYDVSIHPSYRDTVAVTACGLLQTDDAIFSADGVYPLADALSIFDCDSTVYLNLHILSDTFVAIDHTTSEPSYSWQGEEYTESGIYTKRFEGVNGCDSIVSLYLTFANTTGIHGVSSNDLKAWAAGRTIYIANSVGKPVAVFNSNGVHLYDLRPDSNPMQLSVRDRGAYFVVFANGIVSKVMVY